MRDYLPIIFEVLIAGAVILWGVRELVLLKRDEKKQADEGEDDAS